MRINDRINATEVRLISSSGDQVGVVTKAKALEIAKSEELDLVEIVANQTPPVCRVMDFGKYKFEQSKKAHADYSILQIVRENTHRLSMTNYWDWALGQNAT